MGTRFYFKFFHLDMFVWICKEFSKTSWKNKRRFPLRYKQGRRHVTAHPPVLFHPGPSGPAVCQAQKFIFPDLRLFTLGLSKSGSQTLPQVHANLPHIELEQRQNIACYCPISMNTPHPGFLLID